MKKIQKLVSVVGPFATIGQKVNEIIDANPPLEAGTGLIITRSESNILIGLDKSSIKNRIPPWFLTGIIETSPAAAKIRVNPGMVNNSVPTIGVTSLVAVPAPTITVTGASGQIWLRATVDSAGTITALALANLTATPTDTVTLKHKLVGTWTSNAGQFTSVTSILNTNQSLILCGGTAIYGA